MLRLPVQTYRNHFVFLPPNRVWRTYHGGRVLDRLTGVSQPTDSHFPEDDFTPRPFDKVFADQRCLPRRREIGSKHSWSEALIGPEQTPCFAVNKFTWGDRVVRTIDRPSTAIITQGSLQIQSSQEVRTLQPYDKVFFPAGIGDVVFTPTPYAEMLECLPPA